MECSDFWDFDFPNFDPFSDSAQFTFREEWWDPRLAYGRFADEETEVPAFVVLATSEQADLTQQIWV